MNWQGNRQPLVQWVEVGLVVPVTSTSVSCMQCDSVCLPLHVYKKIAVFYVININVLSESCRGMLWSTNVVYLLR